MSAPPTSISDYGAVFGDPEHAPRKPRRDDRFVARLDGYDGKGRVRGRVGPYNAVFSGWTDERFHGAVPGARVAGEVLRRRRDRVEARLVELIEAGAEAVEPRCGHFGECGGCAFQDLAYSAQLDQLARRLEGLLAPLGRRDPIQVEPAPASFGYRNKMDFTFSNRRWVERGEQDDGRPLDFALGLHVRGRFQKVLDGRSCAIHFEGADALLQTVRRTALESGLQAWDVQQHTGFWRHAVLRRGHHTGEVLVQLVTAPVGGDPDRARAMERMVESLTFAHPELTTLVHTESTRLATVAAGEGERVLLGPGVIHDTLLGRRFRISAASFFQTNTAAAEKLFGWVAELLADEEGGTLYDLYCGAGAIGLVLADRFQRVIGVEQVAAAIDDARTNAIENGVENVEFHVGDVPAVLAGATALQRPDVAVVDPPRAGLHPDLVRRLQADPPRRLIYVSCNPESAVRDLEPLLDSAYELRSVRGFDLFPHTPHLEAVFDLRRRA